MSVELLNIDCMEYMRGCADNSFDLAIVDPPYGIGMDGGSVGLNKFDKKGWDKCTPSQEYFDELLRVSKESIIWGGNYFADKLKPTGSYIYWDKMQDKEGHRYGKTFASGELAYTTFKKPMKHFEYKNQGNYIGPPNSITTKTKMTRDLKMHPTQKPIGLYEWLFVTYAEKGQRILDTHLGSGSSAIAAHYFGCDFVGCEIDVDYFNAASERFERETRQLAMF